MSAYAMFPTFTDRESYLAWRAQWRVVYKRLSAEITVAKRKAKNAARLKHDSAPSLHRELASQQAMARKMLAMIKDAEARRDRILGMHKALAEQEALFPLTATNCRFIDFHFNKGSIEFPFLPKWTLKTGGKTYYVSHFESTQGFETMEKDEGSTRGLLRIRRADLRIEAGGHAFITPAAVRAVQEAA
jgi:hypothetical protein